MIIIQIKSSTADRAFPITEYGDVGPLDLRVVRDLIAQRLGCDTFQIKVATNDGAGEAITATSGDILDIVGRAKILSHQGKGVDIIFAV